METKKNPDFLPKLEAALMAYEERSGDNNPNYAELKQLLEEQGTGFSGGKVAERLKRTLSEKLTAAGLRHQFNVYLDQIGRDTQKETQDTRQILAETVFEGRFNMLTITDENIIDGHEGGLLVWEKILPTLPLASQIIEFVESLKDNPEATDLILEIVKLDAEELITEIVETAVEVINSLNKD